jgi:prepilin peptidase CpaA
MLIAGIVFFILFVIGAMGGGDVKLMASVGAWVGSEHVLIMLLAAALAGGVLAIVFVLFRRGLYTAVWNVLELIRFRLMSGFNPHPLLNVREAGTLRVPFGVAIAIGTFICVGNAIWWR